MCSDPDGTTTCHIKDSDFSLKKYIATQSSVLQPDTGHNKQCGMLLFSNLAEASWLLVNCSVAILPNIVCYKNKTSNRRTNTSRQNQGFTSKEGCKKSDIFVQNKCLNLRWDLGLKPLPRRTCRDIDKSLLTQSNCDGIFGTTKQLQENTIHSELAFLYQKREGVVERCEYKKYFHNVSVVATNRGSGFLLCFSNQTLISTNMEIMHACENNEYVSKQFLCDGQNDCVHSKNSDENSCGCKKQSVLCREMQGEKRLKCSALYFKDKYNRCQSFVSHTLTEHSMSLARDNFWSCVSGKKIPMGLVNDLVSDCGFPLYEDETNMLHSPAKDNGPRFPTIQDTCSMGHQLPCDHKSSVCYNISEICIFRLNKFQNMKPCRTGTHLQDCKEFECNGHFKCQESHCIPWVYVCDGKWDCTTGEDEYITCGIRRTCDNMYRCKKTQKCLHINDICDDIPDCPQQEDEFLCSYTLPKCPPSCARLHLAVVCKFAHVADFLNQGPSHISYQIVDCNLSSADSFGHDSNILILNLQKNILTDPCIFRRKLMYKMSVFDVSANHILDIAENCFCNLGKLKYVALRSNKLQKIHSHTFCNLGSIISIDLQDNNLQSISQTAFANISKIYILNIHNNGFSEISYDTFSAIPVIYIHTNLYEICRITLDKIKCSAQIPWFVSSSSLFPSTSVRVLYVCFSALIFALNCISFCVNISRLYKHYSSILIQRQGDRSTGPCNIIISVVNVVDFTCAVYLTVLWAADVHFRQTYILHEKEWKSSFPCSLTFGVALFLSFTTPLVLLFLSIARLMVVKNHFDSRFKSAKFVSSFLLVVFSASLVISLCTTLTIKLFRAQFPFFLCFPFVDPSKTYWEIRVFTVFVTLLHLFTIVSISIAYCLLVVEIKKSGESSGKNIVISKSLLAQLVCLTGSNILCWLPSSIIFLVSLYLDTYPVEMVVWVTVAIMPMNSVADPVIFLTILFKEN